MAKRSAQPHGRRPRRWRIPWASALRRLPAILGLLTAGCLPPHASFDFGLGTSRVSGVFTLTDDTAAPGGPLIVVYKYHHQFVNQGDGRAVVHPSAHVVRPTREGAFSIDMPADVVAMDMLFIAPEHLTEVFQMRRQIGVGDISYQPRLQPMQDWRSHYYTFISPQLEHLIVEPRYRLAPAEAQMLADWLQGQSARLAAMGSGGPRKQTSAGGHS